jgi:hypothetical protein
LTLVFAEVEIHTSSVEQGALGWKSVEERPEVAGRVVIAMSLHRFDGGLEQGHGVRARTEW